MRSSQGECRGSWDARNGPRRVYRASRGTTPAWGSFVGGSGARAHLSERSGRLEKSVFEAF